MKTKPEPRSEADDAVPDPRRRALLSLLVPAALTGCAGAGASGSYILGAFPCLTGDYYGPTYDASVHGFDDLDLVEQQGPELCWAAAIAAVLAHHGRQIDQRDIVQRVRGASNDRGFTAGTLREVIKGISGPWTTWHVNNGNSMHLVQDLNNGNPVLLGLRGGGDGQGHIVVAYGATYAHNYADGRTYVESVEVWNPWYGAGFETLDGCEVKDQVSFALHAWGPA